MSELATDQQCIDNDFVREVTFENGHKVMMPMPPVQFHDTYDKMPYKVSGGVGRDTNDIMNQYGYTDEEIKAMRDQGAVI